MRETPVLHFRPVAHYDGEAKNKEIVSSTRSTLWVDIIPHSESMDIVLAVDEDIQIGDIILVPAP